MGIEPKLKSREITSNSCGNGSQEKRFCMALAQECFQCSGNLTFAFQNCLVVGSFG